MNYFMDDFMTDFVKVGAQKFRNEKSFLCNTLLNIYSSLAHIILE